MIDLIKIIENSVQEKTKFLEVYIRAKGRIRYTHWGLNAMCIAVITQRDMYKKKL